MNDALIEVAALVTDSELNILGDGVDVVIKPDDAALAQMNDFVRDMHTRSGLLEELPQRQDHGRGRGRSPRVHQEVGAGSPEGAAGRKLGGHGPCLPGP